MSKESFSIALIDADLLCNKKQRFPNLALMKLSSYWKLKKFKKRSYSYNRVLRIIL